MNSLHTLLSIRRLRRLAIAALAAICCAAARAADADVMPMDPGILHGRLPNGLEYYVYQCFRPAYKANFYLVENVGCVVEEPAQQGMAHFVEHMAFNGTEHFPGNSLAETLEAAGLSFGYDINAYTGLDHTVYRICDIDTRISDGIVDTCLLMLKDISCGLTLDPAAVDSERRIIMEEWRQDNGAGARIAGQLAPVIYGQGSPYALKPIGKPETIAAFTAESLRQFYEKWYQPQHQAVVVIGYVDPDEIEAKIADLWGGVRPKGEPSVREWAQVPAGNGPVCGIVTDPELTGSQIDLAFRIALPGRDARDTLGYLNESLLCNTAQIILSARLADILFAKDSPWSAAEADLDQYYNADSMDMLRFYALYDFNLRDNAVARLLAEAKRAAVHGITADELEMAKQSLRSYAEELPAIVDEMNNDEHFERISDHVLKRNVVSSPFDDAAGIERFADTVSVEAVNRCLRSVLVLDNLVSVLVENSANPGIPSADSLRQMIVDQWRSLEVGQVAASDAFSRPLIGHELRPGKVVSFDYDTIFDARHYRLANGARVTLCRRSVLDLATVRAVQRGGESALLDSGYVDGYLAADIADISGMGSFSATDLMRRSLGKSIDLSITYTPYAEIIEGEARMPDLEALLQMLHLRLTSARFDPDAVENYRKTLKAQLADRGKDPSDALNDSIYSVQYGLGHPYIRRLRSADLDSLDAAHAIALFESRIANPAAYDFIIVGNFDFPDVEPLIEKYIGSLPGDGDAPRQPFHKIDRLAREGVVRKRFSVPSESELTSVYLNYEIHHPYAVTDEAAMRVLASIVEKMCLQSLRAEAGATYSPSVRYASGEVDGFHSLFIRFDTNPQAAEQLLADTEAIIAQIAQQGPDPDLFAAAKDYEKNLEYVSSLQQRYPIAHFTHLALYGDTDYYDTLYALRDLAPSQVQSIAAALAAAPVRTALIMDQTAPIAPE